MIGITNIKGITLVGLILLAIGVASAMWMETLRVNTYVHTGEVKVAWVDWTCSDTGPDPQSGDPYHNSEGKNVAECIVEPEVYDEEGNVVKVNITLVNAYPGYAPEVTLKVKNIGTIPVKLLNYATTGVDTTALSVDLTIPEDTQIHPDGTLDLGIKIAVEQGAEEHTMYTFEVEYTFAQWNEVP